MTMPGSYHFPSSNFGYWRGDIGVAGPGAAGRKEMGTATQGVGMASQGTVNVAGTEWHPTIIYLFVLLLAEMLVFGFIGRILK